MIDGSGNRLASGSNIDPLNTGESYELAFDPPGHGLMLSATPYQLPLPIVNRLVAVALVLLAITVLVSLWLLRRHVQHRLRAEGELRREYAFRKAMDNSTQTGLRARDMEGRIIYVNSAFCRMVGWGEKELVGLLPPMPYWAEGTVVATTTLNNQILAGKGPQDGFELLFQRRNGERFVALVNEAPLIDGNGNQTGWMGSVIDISERKRLEEHEARQREHLAVNRPGW